MTQPAFTLLSTTDTDLLSARASGAGLAAGQPGPARRRRHRRAADGSALVVVRILGVRRQYEELLAPLLAGPAPVVVLGGEQVPDAELMELSTVPVGVATEAHGYLAQGGPDNLGQLHRFLSDTVLLTGEGFEPPSRGAGLGRARPRRPATSSGPTVAVLYYRAHHLAGNTAFVEALCARDRGRRRPGAAGVHRLAAVGRRPGCSRRCAPPTRWWSPCSRPAARGRPPPRPAGTTAPGTSARSPRSTCRCSRGCA